MNFRLDTSVLSEVIAARPAAGRAEAARRTMSLIDALVAATAEVHDLTLVTRNIRDFEIWGGPVFNPWAAPSS